VDIQSLDRWDDYTEAKNAMFFHTHTGDAPWVCNVYQEPKRFSRPLYRWLSRLCPDSPAGAGSNITKGRLKFHLSDGLFLILTIPIRFLCEYQFIVSEFYIIQIQRPDITFHHSSSRMCFVK
jgi:hypothetical protein